MRILVVHQYYLAPREPGGSRFNELARLWAEAGHDVTVVAGTVNYTTGARVPDTKGWLTRRMESGIDVIRCHVPASYHRSALGRMWAFLGFTLTSTLGALRAGRPDVVIATSPPLTTGLTGWIASRWYGARFVFEIRDLWPESAVTTGVLHEGTLLTRALYALERLSCRKADVINVLTPAFASDLTRRGLASTDRIVQVSNGADLDAFEPGSRHNAARERYGWGDRFVALYAGAHGRANALMQLVDAAFALRNRKDILVATVGDGPERAACERAAADRGLTNIQFLGPVPKDAMPELINACDVGLAVLQDNPTFRTVYPNKVFDYMACSRPAIVAIDGVCRHLVCEQAHAGLYVPPENAAKLADAIVELHENPADAARFAMSGREWVVQHMDRRVLATRYLDVLSRLVCSIPAEVPVAQ